MGGGVDNAPVLGPDFQTDLKFVPQMAKVFGDPWWNPGNEEVDGHVWGLKLQTRKVTDFHSERRDDTRVS